MKKSLAALAIAGLIGFGVLSAPAEAGSASVGTITVTGSGSMTLKRDQATTNLSVTALADKAADAMSRATVTYNTVRKAILDLGIKADALTTSGISLYPEWDYSPTYNGGKAILKGYRVYMSVQVTTTVANSAKVLEFAALTKMALDDPDTVADRIVDAVAGRRREVYLGFPEALFVRLNAILPALVDRALSSSDRRVAKLFPPMEDLHA